MALCAHEKVAFEVRRGCATRERHREVELGGEVVDDPADARFAAGGEAVDARAAEAEVVRAQREGFHGVGAGADAAVEADFELSADGVDDGGERGDGGNTAVDLAAAVVGDDQSLHAAGEGAARAARSFGEPDEGDFGCCRDARDNRSYRLQCSRMGPSI